MIDGVLYYKNIGYNIKCLEDDIIEDPTATGGDYAFPLLISEIKENKVILNEIKYYSRNDTIIVGKPFSINGENITIETKNKGFELFNICVSHYARKENLKHPDSIFVILIPNKIKEINVRELKLKEILDD